LAIKHYLRLGFRPALVTEPQRETWRGLFEAIGSPGLVREIGLDRLPLMSSWAFWWRTMLVTQYTGWLNFKADVF
jgi:hypothetical protein